MTQNQIYTICGLIEMAKTKTAKIIAEYEMKIADYPEAEKELKKTIKTQVAIYKHYEECLKSVKELSK